MVNAPGFINPRVASSDAGNKAMSAIPTLIGQLSDVDLITTPPVDGDVLIYDGASSTWKPGTVTAAPAPVAVADLTDVDETTPPVDGDVLIYDGASSTWKPGAPPAPAVARPFYWAPPTAAHFSTMYASLRGGLIANAISVADDSDVGMTFTDPSTDNGYIKAFGRPIPLAFQGGNFTITAHIRANSISGNDQFGLWARCSATKYLFFNLFNRGGSMNIQRGVYNAAWSDGSFAHTWETNEIFLRLAIANQTTSYFISLDGKTWVAPIAAENLFTAPFTDYGFCIGRFTLTNYSVTVDQLVSDEFP